MKQITLITLLLLAVVSQAQDVELSKSQLNINGIPLSLSYEGRIDDNKSFTLSGGLGFTGAIVESNSETESYFFVVPAFSTSLRNYYTRKSIKKDNLQNNSGNYFGIYATYQTEPFGDPSNLFEALAYEETSNVYTFGPVWGIERNYASGIHLGLSLGAGVIGGKYIDTSATIIGEFELGFVLFSK